MKSNYTNTGSPQGISFDRPGGSVLDLDLLDNLRRRGNKLEAACPACREAGRDRSGNHLIIFADGRYGCVTHPGDTQHWREIRALVGWANFTGRNDYRPSIPAPREDTLERHDWPELELGSERDLRVLSELRKIGIPGLRLAQELGVLRFFGHRQNGRCWTVTDSARFVRQDRRLDGGPFVLGDKSTAKSRTLGRASWPVGAAQIADFPVVLFCEGGPDLLAALHLIEAEGRVKDVTAVTNLGAGLRIASEAVSEFAGKRIRFFAHEDTPGYLGVVNWWRQIQPLAGKVDVFTFQGWTKEDGSPVRDVNDFLEVEYDIWDLDINARNPIPYNE